jgi:hypothetical protein
MKQRAGMPEFFNGLVGSGNNHGIKTKDESSKRYHYGPAQEFVVVHMQSFLEQ